MSTEASKAVVRRMVEQSMIAGDLDAAVAAYAPNFVYHNPVLADLPSLPPGAVAAMGTMVCRVAEGRIVEEWDVDDRQGVMQQLGLIPTPEHAAA